MLIQLNSNFHLHELLFHIATLGSTVICQIQPTLPPNAPKEFPSQPPKVVSGLPCPGGDRQSEGQLAELGKASYFLGPSFLILLFLFAVQAIWLDYCFILIVSLGLSTKLGKISSVASFVISFIRLEHARRYFFLVLFFYALLLLTPCCVLCCC